jgi:hypothetical protein
MSFELYLFLTCSFNLKVLISILFRLSSFCQQFVLSTPVLPGVNAFSYFFLFMVTVLFSVTILQINCLHGRFIVVFLRWKQFSWLACLDLPTLESKIFSLFVCG